MSQNFNDYIPDVYKLEINLQEKLNELTWKSKALEETQRELMLVRQELLNKELILEDCKRQMNDLKMQVTMAHNVVELLEKDKAKYLNERLQLQVNCDSAMKERESLLEQAHAAKLENMTLKLNVQKLMETVNVNESAKSSLETSLLHLQSRFSHVYNTLQSNISKLEKEHVSLLKSVDSTSKLNKRLQTVGLCAHAVFTRKNEEIKRLQNILNNSKEYDEHIQTHLGDSNGKSSRHQRLDVKAILDKIRMDEAKDHEADMEIEAIFKEY